MTEQYLFFCDESGITQDQFLVVGGVVVPASARPRITRGIDALRAANGMRAELKWTKITDQKEREYRDLIDYFFRCNRIGLMHFHTLIVPYRRFDHKTFHHDDRDLSLHKLYYQLILHRFCRNYGRDDRELIVHVDLSCVPFCGPQACRLLNIGSRKHYGMTGNPVAAVEPLDSTECDLLQINDIILGAVCSYKNHRHLKPEGRQAKRRLAEYVLQQSGVGSYDRDTPLGNRRFTVWNFRSRLLRGA